MEQNEKQIMFWVCGFILIVGMFIGILIGYFAMPHINYTVTIQPGDYTFDIGPTAAKLIGDSVPPETYSAPSEQTIDSGNIEWNPSMGPKVIIAQDTLD